MREIFNIASLATLSKSELQGLLANYQAKLPTAQSEPEKTDIRARISRIQLALSQK